MVNDVVLTRRRQDELARLRTITGTQLARRWRSLPAYTADNEDRWAELAAPVVEAGQRRAAATQISYLQALLGPVRFDMASILDAATIDLRQPFIALATALSVGTDLAGAVDEGALRAASVGESGVQWAARAANDATSGDQRIVGWTRTLGPNPCDWCQTVSTQRYHSAESASFGHLRCDCGVDPIIGDRDPGRVINTELLDQLKSRSGATPDA